MTWTRAGARRAIVFALEGVKGGPVREFGRAPNHDDYMKLDPEMQKRTIEFIRKNAAAKKPFFVDYWPIGTSFLGFPNRVTASGGFPQEGLARLDRWIGELMAELKALGIAENTLVILMADNGPMTHNGPPGMVETLYRGGKGDYLEGGVRVPAMAWWPGVIAPGQTVGDIIHETDLFTTFARLAGATEHVPTDRIMDGVDQTALFLKGDAHQPARLCFHLHRRRFGRDREGALQAGLGRRASRPVRRGVLRPLQRSAGSQREDAADVPGKGHVQHHENAPSAVDGEIPESQEARGFPLTGIENARPETVAAGRPRVDVVQASVRSVRIHEVAARVERHPIR